MERAEPRRSLIDNIYISSDDALSHMHSTLSCRAIVAEAIWPAAFLPSCVRRYAGSCLLRQHYMRDRETKV